MYQSRRVMKELKIFRSKSDFEGTGILELNNFSVLLSLQLSCHNEKNYFFQHYFFLIVAA